MEEEDRFHATLQCGRRCFVAELIKIHKNATLGHCQARLIVTFSMVLAELPERHGPLKQNRRGLLREGEFNGLLDLRLLAQHSSYIVDPNFVA